MKFVCIEIYLNGLQFNKIKWSNPMKIIVMKTKLETHAYTHTHTFGQNGPFNFRKETFASFVFKWILHKPQTFRLQCDSTSKYQLKVNLSKWSVIYIVGGCCYVLSAPPPPPPPSSVLLFLLLLWSVHVGINQLNAHWTENKKLQPSKTGDRKTNVCIHYYWE